MAYEEIMKKVLKEFNLPKLEFGEYFKSNVIIPCLDLLEEQTNSFDELDYNFHLSTFSPKTLYMIFREEPFK